MSQTTKPTAATVLTGSTGNAVQDGAIRGSYGAALIAATYLLCGALGADDAQTGYAVVIMTFIGGLTAGLFDKLYKKYLS